MEEGRDFFEAWGVKQLQQEATKRRGIPNIQGLPQQSLAELLIEDETKKRLRRELKERAPLVEKWCHVVGLETQQCWNGRKVKVTDFYDGTSYIVIVPLAWCLVYVSISNSNAESSLLPFEIDLFRSIYGRMGGSIEQEEVPTTSTHVFDFKEGQAQA
jgi:hypothetical protein